MLSLTRVITAHEVVFGLMFAFTRSSSSALVNLDSAVRFRNFSHRRNSVSVQYSGSPLGSFSAGNTSPPHIFHREATVTSPAKPRKRLRDCKALSTGVGILGSVAGTETGTGCLAAGAVYYYGSGARVDSTIREVGKPLWKYGEKVKP